MSCSAHIIMKCLIKEHNKHGCIKHGLLALTGNYRLDHLASLYIYIATTLCTR